MEDLMQNDAHARIPEEAATCECKVAGLRLVECLLRIKCSMISYYDRQLLKKQKLQFVHVRLSF